MSRPSVTVGPSDSIRQAAISMRVHAVGCVLVVKDGAPIGIVTDRDIAVRAVAPNLDPGAPVELVMSEPVAILPADADLAAAYRTFRRTAIRRLPVVHQDRLVGMLTIDDLFLDVFQRYADLLGPVSWSALHDRPLDQGPAAAAAAWGRVPATVRRIGRLTFRRRPSASAGSSPRG
jgi:CBS-domain-containing membrane protein